MALLLTDAAEPCGSGNVAVAGAEFVSGGGMRGLYRALARDWNWKAGFVAGSAKPGLSVAGDRFKPSESTLALR